MKSHKTIARTFGVFFIIAFLSYGTGSGLTSADNGIGELLRSLNTSSTPFIIGIVLMALVHTFVNIGLPVLMVPTLKKTNKIMSYGYLSAGVTATILVLVGALLLMMIVPLSEMYATASVAEMKQYEAWATLLHKGNFYAYQIGMAIWGLGGVLFCNLLCKSQLVPKVFAIWGTLGYVIFIAGTVAELFGYEIGVMLSIPGGLFEIALSIWLIAKGFKSAPKAVEVV